MASVALDDLQAARDAVLALLRLLDSELSATLSAINKGHPAGTRGGAELGDLESRLGNAEARLNPVLRELEDATGKAPCNHQEALDVARRLLTVLKAPGPTSTNQEELTRRHRWATAGRRDLERYLFGIDFDRTYGVERGGILDKEMTAAAFKRSRRPEVSHSPPRRVGSTFIVESHELELTEQLAKLLELGFVPGGTSFDDVRTRLNLPMETASGIRARVVKLKQKLKVATKATPFRITVGTSQGRIQAKLEPKPPATEKLPSR